jgi:hypothetical protein
MSTNQVHPEAQLPYLDIHKKDCPKWDRLNSTTYEDRIAFHLSDTPNDSRNLGGLVVSCLESKVVMVRVILVS